VRLSLIGRALVILDISGKNQEEVVPIFLGYCTRPEDLAQLASWGVNHGNRDVALSAQEAIINPQDLTTALAKSAGATKASTVAAIAYITVHQVSTCHKYFRVA
jgi:hypothetical protein